MDYDRQTPDQFLPLKPNWFHILLSLSSGPNHGYAIMQAVLERTSGKIKLWPATLYGTLSRLLEEGLIEECSERPREDDDPRRKYYRLSQFGRRVLDAETERLEELVRLIHASRKSPLTEAAS